MTEIIAEHIAAFAAHAHIWGLLLIFVFMTVESSFIPFPSEVVMIPAGFLAFRGELLTGNFWMDAALAVLSGTAGSLAGAYVNYYLALHLGRRALYKYGKYFFLSEKTLARAEQFFRDYGDIGTFVCRLLPGIRQLVSLPAGFARMNLRRFTIFTAAGAGIWVVILTAAVAWLGHLSRDLGYVELVRKGQLMVSENYIWILAGLAVVTIAYFAVHRRVMRTAVQAE